MPTPLSRRRFLAAAGAATATAATATAVAPAAGATSAPRPPADLPPLIAPSLDSAGRLPMCPTTLDWFGGDAGGPRGV